MRESDDPTEGDAPSPTGIPGPVLAEVADGIVRTYKRHLGKAPTRAGAFIDGNLLVCLLEGGFTQSERALQARGLDDQVERHRLAIQKAMEEDLRLVVESVTGRRVLSFRSSNEVDNELQAEIFVLSPELLDLGSAADAMAAAATQVREQAHKLRDEQRALREEQVQVRETLRRRREGRS